MTRSEKYIFIVEDFLDTGVAWHPMGPCSLVITLVWLVLKIGFKVLASQISTTFFMEKVRGP